MHWTQKTAKAAHMRHIMFWLADLCNEHNHDEHSNVRAAFFNSCVEFESACAREERFPKSDACESMADAVETALQCYSWLREDAAFVGLWHMTPKFHMWTHMAYDMAPKANPRVVHCFSDEDLIGKIKRVLERCHGATASSTGIFRYVLWVSLRWWILLHHLKGIPL